MRTGSQPVALGLPENPYPGIDGITTWKASDALAPVGLVLQAEHCGKLNNSGMSAPDTSFHPVPAREEGRPALDVHEHPVAPPAGATGEGEWDYLTEVRRLAVETFLRVGCAGLARVDFFVEEGGRVLVNELNTLPGMTPTSAFPKLWEATGVPWPEACDRLVGLALERHAAERAGHAF